MGNDFARTGAEKFHHRYAELDEFTDASDYLDRAAEYVGAASIGFGGVVAVHS